MGRNVQKSSNKKKQSKPVQPQSQEQSEGQEQFEGSDEENIDQFNGQEDDFAQDSILLKKIQDKINDCDEGQKLAWGAIYSIKQKQAILNEQMQKQIQQIKDKYQQKRLPLLQKISDAVSGKHLQKSLYSENQFTKSINLNKVKPASIPGYWAQVFESSGLVNNQIDIEVLQKLKIFKVQLLNSLTQHIKIHMQFQENQYFYNKGFDLQISGNTEDNTFSKKLSEPMKYKGQKNQESLFSLLFDGQDNQQVRQTSLDLYRAYISSVYFYFYQPQQFQGQDDEGQEQADQEEESDNEEQVKANKKIKPNPALEKPECKNQ